MYILPPSISKKIEAYRWQSFTPPAAGKSRRFRGLICHRRSHDKLFTFTRLSKSQWKSARTTNAIERLNEEFKRRIKTQTVLPCPETVPMLLWALLASGQIQMRKVDGWETLDQLIADETLDRAA